MNAALEWPARILIIARPVLGRRIERALRTVGHEVHRTPDPSDAVALAERLRPQIAVIALDLPWGDAEAAVNRLRALRHAMPVLVLGELRGDSSTHEHLRLPLDVDLIDLQEAIADLLSAPRALIV